MTKSLQRTETRGANNFYKLFQASSSPVGWGEARTPTHLAVGKKCWGSFLTPTYGSVLVAGILQRNDAEPQGIVGSTSVEGFFFQCLPEPEQKACD
jgi:hypothetical protein